MNLYIIILLIALTIALIVCFIAYLKWKITTYATYYYRYKNGVNLPSDEIGECSGEMIIKYLFKRKECR